MATPFPRLQAVPNHGIAPDPAPHWEARLFGDFRLLDPDGESATPTGRKARALVAFLLSSGEHGATRDRLAGLLWSERGEDQARASLRQTLYEIRGLTAGDASLVAVDRTRAAIVTTRIGTDVARIEAFAADDDPVALAATVGEQPPEFLADLDGVDPAFDDWLSVERTRLRDLRRRALLAVAERRLAAGDPANAERLADRLLICDGADETAARIAMEASHLRGDRDRVRRIFVRLQDVLHREIGAEVSSETVEVHRRLMAAPIARDRTREDTPPLDADDRSARLDERDAAPAGQDVGAAVTGHKPAPTAWRAWGSLRTRTRAWTIAGLSVACLAVLGVVALRPATPTATRTLVVEPLRADVADSAALALAAGLSGDLARLIVGNDGTLRVVDASQGPSAPASSSFHVDGEARGDAGVLHATLRLSHEADGPILWSRTFVRPVAEVGALREEMASKLGDVSICALGRTNPQAAQFSVEEMRLLLAACEQIHLDDPEEATKLFKQLLDLRPDFAHGWARVAAAEQISALRHPADAASIEADAKRDAERALALDPNEGEAYYALAMRLRGIDQWSQRMEIRMRGHTLDPANGQLDNAIGNDLEQIGRWQEGELYLQKGAYADPFGVFKVANWIHAVGFGGDTAGAINAILVARKRFANHKAIAYADFEFNALLGDPRRAAAILDDANRGFALRPERAALWSRVIASRAAPSAETAEAADRALREAMKQSSAGAGLILETLGRENRVDEAYAYIDQLPHDLRDQLPTDVLFDVLTRSLRDDPRFMTVAARAGLVAVWTGTDRWPDFCADRTPPYDCRVEARRAVTSDPRPLVPTR